MLLLDLPRMFFRTIERAGRGLLLAAPLLLGLVFHPDLEAPFTDAKNALFFLITGLVTAAWLTVAGRTKGGGTLQSAVHLAALGMAAVAAVAYFVSPWRYLGAIGVCWSFGGLLLFWAMRRLLHGRSHQLLQAIAMAGAAAALIAAVQRVLHLDLFRLFGATSNAPGRMALYGTLGNPDWLAAFLALALPALVSLATSAGNANRRVVWSSFSVLCMAVVIATGSRAGMLAAALGIASALMLPGTRRLRWIAAVLAIAVVVFAIFAPAALNRRTTPTAMRGRAVIWKVALSPPAPTALLGSGPNTFAYLYPLRMGAYFGRHPEDVKFSSYERHAQNDFVETYAENGLFGLGLMVVLGVVWARLAWKVRANSPDFKHYAEASLAALVALAALACFDSPLHRAETWMLSWMWLTLPVLGLESRQEQTKRVGLITLAPAVLIVAIFANFGLRPLVASYRVAIAQQRESLGDLPGAEISLRDGIRSWPNATGYFDLVRVLGKQERYAEALEQSQRAERWVTEPELFLLRVRILRAMQRESEAQQLLQESARRFPYSRDLADEIAGFSQPQAGMVPVP